MTSNYCNIKIFCIVIIVVIFNFCLLSCSKNIHNEGFNLIDQRDKKINDIININDTYEIRNNYFTIETGGHIQRVTDIFFNKNDNCLISVSMDKSIRFWDIKTGKLKHFLRTQIGEKFYGSIFTASLSSDNKYLAIAGCMGNNLGDIRIINTQTYKIEFILRGHTNIINDLNFSLDSNLLLSASSDKTARLWNVQNQKTIYTLKHDNNVTLSVTSPDNDIILTATSQKEFKLWNVNKINHFKNLNDFSGNINDALFIKNGDYFISTSTCNKLKLWDGRTGKFIKILCDLGNAEGYCLSISPSGNEILVGLKGGNIFVISLDSGDLISSFMEHTNSVFSMSISPDGNFVASAGGDNNEIFIWETISGRILKKFYGKGATIWNVGFSPDGKFIGWGKMRLDKWLYKGNLTNLGYLEKRFQITSKDENFSFSQGEILNRNNEYIRGICSVGDLRIKTENNDVDDNLYIIKKNKIIHSIKRNFNKGLTHNCITLTHSGKFLISGGTGGHLVSYDCSTGKKVNEFIGHTGTIWSLAVSPDDKMLVSGGTDQIIRLWEIKTGRLLISLFYEEKDDWIVWTPENYFDSSKNGSKYIGYTVNMGQDKTSKFIKIGKLYDMFYRPDIVHSKIEGGLSYMTNKETDCVEESEFLLKGIAPNIKIISPTSGKIYKRDVVIEAAVIDQGGGFGKIIWKLNGITIGVLKPESNRGIIVKQMKPDTIKLSKLLTLSPGDNIIQIIAYNENNTIQSDIAQLDLNLQDCISNNPSLFILAIGINKYNDKSLWLNYAVADSKDIVRNLKKSASKIFTKIDTIEIYDQNASIEGINLAFKKISTHIKSNDVFIFFLAGHGITLDGKYFFLPFDFRYLNENSVRQNAINQDQLQSWMSLIIAQKSLVLLDTCNSGSFVKAQLLKRGISEKTAINKLTRATGRAVIAASTDKQVALEGFDGHGVFTYTFLQSIIFADKKYGNGDGVVTTSEVSEFINEQVPKNTYNKWGYEQIPQVNLHGRSFPICLSRSNN